MVLVSTLYKSCLAFKLYWFDWGRNRSRQLVWSSSRNQVKTGQIKLLSLVVGRVYGSHVASYHWITVSFYKSTWLELGVADWRLVWDMRHEGQDRESQQLREFAVVRCAFSIGVSMAWLRGVCRLVSSSFGSRDGVTYRLATAGELISSWFVVLEFSELRFFGCFLLFFVQMGLVLFGGSIFTTWCRNFLIPTYIGF